MAEIEQPSRRSYQQHCGLAKALDVVGERWTLLIVRELLLGPRRWGQLLDKLPGLTTNLLAKRLSELQSAGLIERVAAPPGDPEPGRKGWYRLSEAGRALEPTVMELARWGARFMAGPPAPEDRVELGWALLSSKRRYSRAASRPRVVVELGAIGRAGEQQRFQLRCEPGYLDVHEGAPWPADVVVDGEREAFFDLLFRSVPGRELIRRGALVVIGDEDRLCDALASFAGVRW
ncbi:winged helix-turn-helix transcriptional regulator [Nannocystaceae bacterium ST9]